jgi:hypothetical protein
MTVTQVEGSLEWVEENTPTYAEGVATLYSWSSNYEDFKPFRKFLDLIGFAETYYGDDSIRLADWKNPTDGLGYMEIGYLADALQEYANRPQDVERFIMEILDVEGEAGL